MACAPPFVLNSYILMCSCRFQGSGRCERLVSSGILPHVGLARGSRPAGLSFWLYSELYSGLHVGALFWALYWCFEQRAGVGVQGSGKMSATVQEWRRAPARLQGCGKMSVPGAPSKLNLSATCASCWCPSRTHGVCSGCTLEYLFCSKLYACLI